MEKIDDKSKKRYINILRRNFLFDQADDFPKEKLLNDERAEWLSFEKGEASDVHEEREVTSCRAVLA